MAEYPHLMEYETPSCSTQMKAESAKRVSQIMLESTINNIIGPRNDHYGPPTQNFQDTADLWNVLFRDKLDPDERFNTADVAMAMAALKMARLANDDSVQDSWSDLAGYAALGWECVANE